MATQTIKQVQHPGEMQGATEDPCAASTVANLGTWCVNPINPGDNRTTQEARAKTGVTTARGMGG